MYTKLSWFVYATGIGHWYKDFPVRNTLCCKNLDAPFEYSMITGTKFLEIARLLLKGFSRIEIDYFC